MVRKLIVLAMSFIPNSDALTGGCKLSRAPAAEPLMRMKITRATMFELTCQIVNIDDPIRETATSKVVTGPTLSAMIPKRSLPKADARLLPATNQAPVVGE